MSHDSVPPPVDRRTSIRQAANTPVALLCESWAMLALIEDVSESGLLLLTQDPIEVGTTVQVHLLLGSHVHPPLKATASIVRSERREISTSYWTHQVALQTDHREGPWKQALDEIVQRQASLRNTDI